MQTIVQSSLSSCVSAFAAAGASSKSAPVVARLGVITPALSISEFTANAISSKLPVIAKRSVKRGVVCMAKAAPVAVGYASALIDVAQANKSLEKVHKDVESLANLLGTSDLEGFLSNPIILEEKKKAIIKTVADDASFSPYTVNFLNLLVDKKRINLIKDVIEAFESLYCQVTDTQVAEVVSAVKLENSQQALIAKKLQALTGAKNIKLKNAVDSALIAGFVIKYGAGLSSSIDMSVKGQLDRLTAQFDLAEAL